MRELAGAHLDRREILSRQDKKKLDLVCKLVSSLSKFFHLRIPLLIEYLPTKAQEKFEFLREYENHWVQLSFLATTLKNSAERYRAKQKGNKRGGSENLSVSDDD